MSGIGENETNAGGKRLNEVSEDMKRMLRSGNQQGMFSVSVPEAVMPQFQLLVKIAQLRTQGENVAKPLAGGRESLLSRMKTLLNRRCEGLRSAINVRLLRKISGKILLRASMMKKDWRKTSLLNRLR